MEKSSGKGTVTPGTWHVNVAMPTAKPNRLLIVDGHAYAYRAFYAIRELSSPDGAPTNAIYGFIKMLGKLQLQLAPSHAVVVWDGGLSPERTVEHPGYKAQRPPMPESLGQQIDQIGEFLTAAGIASVCQEGVEADDWIAAFAAKASEEMPMVVASSDKDFMQLVSPHMGLANPSDKSDKVWVVEDVVAKSGVLPCQIVDWLSLIGDSVDNIPGVPGVGPKTATDLLKKFGTVESLYARLDEVKSQRLRDSLAVSREVVQMNQRLIRLKPAELPANLDEAEIRPSSLERLRELYAGW